MLRVPSLTLWEYVYIYGAVNDPSVFNDKNIYILTDLMYFEFVFLVSVMEKISDEKNIVVALVKDIMLLLLLNIDKYFICAF